MENRRDNYVKPPEPEEIPAPSLTGHMWKQQGNKLICTSCGYEHVVFLQPGMFLKANKDGVPVIGKL